MDRIPKRVVIVGGGVAGLAAAYYVQEYAKQAETPVTYALIEKADRWGGKILTDRIDVPGVGEFVVEGGPDSFLREKPWAGDLAVALGLGDRLLGTNDDRRKTFVLNRGKPVPLPDGVLLIVPTRMMPFALSPLISPIGKLRMGMDLLIPAKRDGFDETLAQFINRRLGSEALDKIAEPLMTGIYNAEADRQSLLATFPRFRAIEEKHGSLIRGMLASKRLRNGARASPPSDRPSTMFISLKAGAQELTDAIVSHLNGDLRLGVSVEKIGSKGEKDPYLFNLSDGSVLEADAIILATPAYAAADLLADMAPESARELREIEYVDTGTISLAYRRDELRHPLNGFGIVIPMSEHRPINAITWSSTKFDYRAPEGYALLRVFFGGSRSPQTMKVDDAGILDIARREIRSIMGVDAEPIFHRINRWYGATPQYHVGHLDKVKRIEEGLPPGVYVAGSPYRGIGVPDCVHQGQLAAEQTIDACGVSGVGCGERPE